jgi:hypothetical protein
MKREMKMNQIKFKYIFRERGSRIAPKLVTGEVGMKFRVELHYF